MKGNPHDYGCSCARCKAMAAAIAAQGADGNYFFSEAELLELSEREWPGCPGNPELRWPKEDS